MSSKGLMVAESKGFGNPLAGEHDLGSLELALIIVS